MNTALQSQNQAWGFYGTIGQQTDADAAWEAAFAALRAINTVSDEVIRWFLDSRSGRHFADDVADSLIRGATIATAVDQAITRWMGWKISRATSRDTGIPSGLPYLTGYLAHAEIQLDLSA